jgi:hypothetical protein
LSATYLQQRPADRLHLTDFFLTNVVVDIGVKVWKIPDGEADVKFDLPDESDAVFRYSFDEFLQGLQVGLMS